MNAEQVCEMIDAITEGRNFTLHPTESPMTEINFEGDEISVFPPAHEGYFDITETRTAREIAGALVAWANRKDGKGFLTPLMREAQQSIVKSKTESSLSNWSNEDLQDFLANGELTELGRRDLEAELSRRAENGAKDV